MNETTDERAAAWQHLADEINDRTLAAMAILVRRPKGRAALIEPSPTEDRDRTTTAGLRCST
jgi:hypothetical protein